MNRNNHILHLIIMIVFLVLQSVLFSRITRIPAFVDFAFIIFIFSSISLGSAKAQTIGFIVGLVLDFMSESPLGMYSLIFASLGFILGSMKGKFFIDPIIVPILIVIVCSVIRQLSEALFSSIFWTEIPIFDTRFLIKTGLNLAAAPIIIAFMKLFKILTFIDQDYKL